MAAVFRRVIAGLILGPALLIGSLSWWGFLALRTVFDENRTETVAEELLDNEAVADQISRNIGRALRAAMPESVELTDDQVDAGADIIFADPEVRAQIIGALGATHRAFLGLDDAPTEIDIGPALVSARERIGVFAPGVAEAIPEAFTIDLPTERIPNASPIKTFLEWAVPLLATISIVMVLLAFMTTSDRSRVLRRAARWAIGTTAFYLLIGLGVPYVLRAIAPSQAEVLAALLTAILRAAVYPSIVLGVIGGLLLVLSWVWPERERDRRPRRRDERAVVAASPAPARSARGARQVRRSPPAPGPAPVAAPRPVDPTTTVPSTTPRPVDPTTAIPAAPPPLPTPAPPPLAPPPSFSPPDPAAPDPTAATSRPPATGSDPASYRPRPAPDPAPHRPTLPTRAKPLDSPVFPPWTGESTDTGAVPPTPATPSGHEPDEPNERAGWLPPTWNPEHGWVMDPDDPRDPPNNARFVEGVGWVVPGPPPVS